MEAERVLRGMLRSAVVTDERMVLVCLGSRRVGYLFYVLETGLRGERRMFCLTRLRSFRIGFDIIAPSMCFVQKRYSVMSSTDQLNVSSDNFNDNQASRSVHVNFTQDALVELTYP